MWVKFILSSRPCFEKFYSGQRRIQGRGPAPAYFWTKLRPEGAKNVFWGDRPSALSKGLDDPTSPLSQDLDQALPGTPVLSTLSSKITNLNFDSISNAYH